MGCHVGKGDGQRGLGVKISSVGNTATPLRRVAIYALLLVSALLFCQGTASLCVVCVNFEKIYLINFKNVKRKEKRCLAFLFPITYTVDSLSSASLSWVFQLFAF